MWYGREERGTLCRWGVGERGSMGGCGGYERDGCVKIKSND
jgi:hypothetical protein